MGVLQRNVDEINEVDIKNAVKIKIVEKDYFHIVEQYMEQLVNY
jgi:hypothetical protein